MTDVNALYRRLSTHGTALRHIRHAGCFSCGAMFAPAAIEDRGDDPRTLGTVQGRAALCPKCGIDAVLPSSDIKMTFERLGQ